MIVRRDATAAQLQNMYGSQEAQGAYLTAPVGLQSSLAGSLDLSMEG